VEEAGFEPSVPRMIDDAFETALFASATLSVPPERPTRFARGTGGSNPASSTSESGANGGGCGMRNAGSNDASEDDGGGTQRWQRAFSLRVSAGWNAAQ